MILKVIYIIQQLSFDLQEARQTSIIFEQEFWEFKTLPTGFRPSGTSLVCSQLDNYMEPALPQ